MNLIPYYQAYSKKLKALKDDLIDQENLKIINKFTRQHSRVIIGWGNHPIGLFDEYEQLKNSIMAYLTQNKNKFLYVDKLSKSGNPKHGQMGLCRYANSANLII